MADHRRDEHKERLHSLCRVCGLRCQTAAEKRRRPPVRVANHVSDILMAYGISAQDDNEEIHSKHLCTRCLSRIGDIKKSGQSIHKIEATTKMLQLSTAIWSQFSAETKEEDCLICSHYHDTTKPGRYKKSGRRMMTQKLPACSTAHSPPSSLQEDAVHLPEANNENIDVIVGSSGVNTTPNISSPPQDTNFTSGADTEEDESLSFTELLLGPSITDTESSVAPLVQETFSLPSCSVRSTLSMSMSHAQSANISSILPTFSSHSVPMTCTDSMARNIVYPSTMPPPCLPYPTTTTILPRMSDSISNTETFLTCSHNITPGSSSSPVKFISAIEKVLIKSVEEPLSSVEEELHTNLVRRKLHYSKDNTVRVKTGGQPIVLTKVKSARKTSGFAKSPLKKKRARMLKFIRQKIAGSLTVDEEKQRTSELKLLPFKTRESVCGAAGIKCRTVVNKKFGLALKSHIGLTWTQYRKQKQMFKRAGVKFEGEGSERKEMEKFVPQLHETVLQGSSKFTKVCIKHLCHFVTDVLHRYSSAKLLTWHDGKIPNNKIWVKIGGDYGKKSFKMALEIINLENPNSPDNTFPLLIANVKDTKENLEVMMQHFRNEIHELQHMQWEGKQIRLSLFGDYDFLCNLYGHQGAKSSHPCLWCYIKSKDLQKHKSVSPSQRTLDSVKQDFKNFKGKGKGDRRNAKYFNNITREPLLDVSLDHVAPPYLHILLGIVKKHHDLLEAKCNEIDKWIAKDLVQNCHRSFGVGVIFDNFVNKLIDLSERKQLLEGQVAFHELDETPTNIQHLYDEIIYLDDELSERETEYVDFEGPICIILENVLNRHKIVRQAYHSKSFIGNHCHKYLQRDFLKDLSDSIKQKVIQLTKNAGIIAKTIAITVEYNATISQYRHVHNQVSHKRQIAEEDVDHIKHDIAEYMRLFQKKNPNVDFIPKQHLLESHCPDWLTRYGFGMAMHGEQGGERMHATLHRIERAASGILREADRLKYIMRTAIAKNAPELREEIPPLKKRKLAVHH